MKGLKTKLKMFLCILLSVSMILPSMPVSAEETSAEATDSVVIDATAYGADKTGATDSAEAIWAALEAAKEASENGTKAVTLNFPKGEYHIYKDRAQVREWHTSNTNSTSYPQKTIGLLIEEQKNLTIEGNGSLFMMHGNMMALAVAKSENITLHDFAWDFAVPTVSEMTVVGMGSTGSNQYTDFYIPECFPYEISGTTIKWKSELSPYTGQTYWTKTGIHENAYSIVVHQPEDEMTRIYGTGNENNPFAGVSSIEQLEDNQIRITYSGSRKENQKLGHVFEFHSGGTRETAGAFTWESKNVTAQNINVHFMHGFGWLVQMSENVYYRNCNFMPRKDSGHLTVSYADGIHASGAKGDFVIENCNFAHAQDDPINMHGTFTRVEQRVDDHTLKLKYIHAQQGGFPQFHEGDMVQFFTRDTLESTDNEAQYTVAEVVSNPGESGNDLKTMVIRFEETLPSNLSDTVSGEPKYVAENVSYAPSVTIKGCTFKNISTRGILCTTRNKVVIEDNIFYPSSMASIFLSNDSNDWYESGPIRDMTIRNNTFYVKDIGGKTSWTYASAIYIHPVTKGGGLPAANNPIHKNITVEGNTFYMDEDTVVKAESVENLKFINNKILRMNPEVSIELSLAQGNISVGEAASLQVNATGNTNSQNIDNVFDFTKSKDITIKGNTYDDGLKLYAVDRNSGNINLDIEDEEITIVTAENKAPTAAVQDLVYVSSDPAVVAVDSDGVITGKSAGTVEVFAYYLWDGTMIRSNTVAVTVEGTASAGTIAIAEADNLELAAGETKAFTVTDTQANVTWSVVDFETDGETEAATISDAGVLSAVKPGIVWVVASSGTATDRKAVVISGTVDAGMTAGFSITREDETMYNLQADSIEIAMQTGDLYQTYNSNNVKNLVLYDPAGVSKENLRTVIKVEGLPVNESNQWDTASFILYNDDDNYVTVGKKSHYNGFATVVEKSGTATETPTDAEHNSVTTAYLGFTKIGDTISVDYKLEDGTWTNVREITDHTVGNDYRIGIAAWHSNDRGKKVTFSEFHVGSAETTTYESLCAETAIAFTGTNSEKPSVSDVTLATEGTKAVVNYTYTDSNAEGRSLYRFTWEENGETVTRISTSKEIDVAGIDTISCQVYPVGQYGNPGTPSKAVTASFAGEQTAELYSIAVNGQNVYSRGGEKEITVSIPAEASKIVLSYVSVNSGVGTAAVSQNGKALEGSYANTAKVLLTVADGDVITITRGDFVYTLNVKLVGSDSTELERIVISKLNFNETALDNNYYYLNASGNQKTVQVQVTTAGCESVEILLGDYRTKADVVKDGTTYTADVQFKDGLNTFYVRAIAADGTVEQYIFAVTYSPAALGTVSEIIFNGVSFEWFASNSYEYFYELAQSDESLKVEVIAELAESVSISLNGTVINAATAVLTDFADGENELIVTSTAQNGTIVKEYVITVFKSYSSNAGLKSFVMGTKEIKDNFSESGSSSQRVAEETAVKISAQDSRAQIVVKKDGNVLISGTGTAEGTITFGGEGEVITVEITAANGITKKTFVVILKEAAPEASDASGDVPVAQLTAISGSQYVPGTSNEGPDDYVLDGNANTHWHTNWETSEGSDAAKRWIGVELSEPAVIEAIRYLPRTYSGSNGAVTTYRIEYQAAANGEWIAVAEGSWDSSDSDWKRVDFDNSVTAVAVRLVGVDTYADSVNNAHMSAAEFRVVYGTTTETPVVPENKQELSAKVEGAKAYKAEDYTETSFAALEAAFAKAEAVLENEASIKEEIEAAMAELEAAIKALETKDGENAGENPGGNEGTHTHTWNDGITKSEATVFDKEVKTYTCTGCKASEDREVGEKLAPAIETNAVKDKITLQKKQTAKGFQITELEKGDSIVSIKSSNKKVVEVEKVNKANGTCTLKAGKLTGKKGKATITIILASGLKKTIKVTVQKAKVKTTKINVLTKKINLTKGQKQTLKPVLVPFTSQDKMKFTTSNKKVVTVTSKGKLTAKKKGKATIKVQAGKKTVKVKVTVK